MKKTIIINIVALFCVCLSVWLFTGACGPSNQAPKLSTIYKDLAGHEDHLRNPVILIPGFLGSRLVDEETQKVAWGAFGTDQMSPNNADGAELIALPMEKGKKLSQLKDNVVSVGALDRIVFTFFGYPLEHHAYANILSVLGIGGYRDQDLSDFGVIEYGDTHFTCFQYDYDWRRDIVENAAALDLFIRDKKTYVQNELEKRFGIKNRNVKFDIVAHSMGGLVARYYMRYGAVNLPEKGLPELTWAGAENVENLILVGTPNAGSMEAFISLVDGNSPAFLLPYYPPAVLGTMPSIYEMLPRSRHKPLLNENGEPVENIFDSALWINNGWGLADKGQDEILKKVLPEIQTESARRGVALDHLKKSLQQAEKFTRSIDIPAKPPESVFIALFASDAEETLKTAQYGKDYRVKIIETGPGDGTVLRSSAIMDERLSGGQRSRLVSPVKWNQVHFIFSDHLGLTKEPSFTDNLLHILLEKPQKRAMK